MKIPVTLVPGGVGPRDPNLTFRMRRTPPATTAETIAEQVIVSTAIGYRDNFDGLEELDAHLPNLGSAYTLWEGVGSLADMNSNNSCLQPTAATDAPRAISSIAGTMGDKYTLSMLFNPLFLSGSAGKGAVIGSAARLASDDVWLIRIDLQWNYIDTDAWYLGYSVRNAAGDEILIGAVPVDGMINLAALNRVTVDVSPSGTVWKINGTEVISDPATPDVKPDSVWVQNFSQDDTASKIVIDEVYLLP